MLLYKAVFVTGGGRGIGRGIAEALAEAGAHVGIGDLQLQAAQETARLVEGRGCRALAVALDVTQAASLEAAASAALYERACAAAVRLGLEAPAAAAVGGASDGNFTAGVGTPTLDGLGAVGGGAHADDEHVIVDMLGARTALLRRLLEDLLAHPREPATNLAALTGGARP